MGYATLVCGIVLGCISRIISRFVMPTRVILRLWYPEIALN